MFEISNEILSVTLSAKGAELQSIYHRVFQLEYLWDADPAFWTKKSPVLFPIVGGLKNNSYLFQGKSYQLNRHGFAREKDFAVTAQSTNSISFTLVSDEATKKVYPFDFRFTLIYTLLNNALSVEYLVENTGKEPMYFSVGAHPAFKVPLVSGTVYSDYYIQFNHPETTGRWPLSTDGLIESEPVPFLENTSTLPLNKEMFYGDALVFKQLISTGLSILNKKNSHGLELTYTNFPYMGIWAFKNADFVCLEPWCGIADNVSSSGELVTKEGINVLGPSARFARSWTVEVF